MKFNFVRPRVSLCAIHLAAPQQSAAVLAIFWGFDLL